MEISKEMDLYSRHALSHQVLSTDYVIVEPANGSQMAAPGSVYFNIPADHHRYT